MQFDEFVASEPEAATAQPMSDEDIVPLTENDVQEESDDESQEEIPSASAIKTSVEFLAMMDQQKAFLKRNQMPTDIVEQLETQVVAMQFHCAVSRSKCKITLKAVQGHLHPQKNQGYLHPSKMFLLRQWQMLLKMFPL